MAHLLHQLLTDAATRWPDRPAVVAPDATLTYAELDRRSNRLARRLQAMGVTGGTRVGLLGRKSAGAATAAYAVLKAGGCYVPLDPSSPDERLAVIVRDCGIALVLADGAGPQAPERLPQGVALVPWEAAVAESADPLSPGATIDTDLAYLLYTSGSTGAPKGVMISHRASLTFVEWAARCVALDEQDRVCSPAPLHFDLSVFDLFAACRAGACMTVAPAVTTMFPVRLAEWIEQERISVWYSVPSLLTMLALHGNLAERDLSALRVVIFAGEVFPAKHLARLTEQIPHARYLNWYGPTETNVCTWYELPPGARPAAPAPIGVACENVAVFAVAETGERVTRPGEEGELFVRGSGLMSGYWGQPETTRRALVANPLQPAYDDPCYRTGDIVTLDEHGNHVFLGRRDGMVKTRGYRVELGEVESALYGHPAVREAVVLPVPDDVVGHRLRAVVSLEPGGSLSPAELLDHCRRRLPAYMVPDALEFTDALPKTSTGKVDRVLLAATAGAGPGGN